MSGDVGIKVKRTRLQRRLAALAARRGGKTDAMVREALALAAEPQERVVFLPAGGRRPGAVHDGGGAAVDGMERTLKIVAPDPEGMLRSAARAVLEAGGRCAVPACAELRLAFNRLQRAMEMQP